MSGTIRVSAAVLASTLAFLVWAQPALAQRKSTVQAQTTQVTQQQVNTLQQEVNAWSQQLNTWQQMLTTQAANGVNVQAAKQELQALQQILAALQQLINQLQQQVIGQNGNLQSGGVQAQGQGQGQGQGQCQGANSQTAAQQISSASQRLNAIQTQINAQFGTRTNTNGATGKKGTGRR
jgi:hypothetical protein